MLAKLLKYEIKATARKFLPIYGAIIIVSMLVNLGIRFPNLDILAGLSSFILTALFISLVVITLMTIIQRFKNNLLSDEGYLMFTLPVSAKKLILSKLITALIWAFTSGIVALLSFLIIVANKDLVSLAYEFFMRYSYYFELIEKQHILLVSLFFISCIFQFIYFVLLVYGSLSIAQMAIFNKHRSVISFVAFIVITIVVSNIVSLIFKNVFSEISPRDIQDMTLLFGTASIVNLALSVIMFFTTDYLLKRHLNIE